ncbi:hypothetical protein WSK_2264 [Novosphingobium sp. Rr 2-17]|nr:hypothetical protein WSK_2264 [Novosphingobium sp. Rr 2-17]
MKTGGLLGVCVCVLALPSAVLAFTTSYGTTSKKPVPIDSLQPEVGNDALARAIAMRSLGKGQMFPFTPAGTPYRPDRSVTVAVRVDPEAAKAIIVRGRPLIAQAAQEVSNIRISPAAFNLGVSRGYQNFAQALVPSAPSAPSGRPMSDLPDLHKFSLSNVAKDKDADSRFSPHLSIDQKKAPGRAPRTFAVDGGEVDVGGAYRVTDHIDLTAGVRYSQERERLLPLTDGRQDSQAVYVGTQFKF